MNRSESGQMTMEMMLIFAVLCSCALMVIKTAEQNKWAAAFVEGPWKPMKGMIEDGTWVGNDSKSFNPGLRAYHGSYEADNVPE